MGSCTGAFEKVMGLPCKYTIAAYLLINKSIPIGDVDRQWHLIHPAPIVSVQQEATLPALATVDRSGRDLSATPTCYCRATNHYDD